MASKMKQGAKAAEEGSNLLGILKRYKSWRAAKNNYWKRFGVSGNAPRRKVRVRKNNGDVEDIWETKELHHKNGRKIDNPHDDSNLEELWPTEHAAKDPSRHTGYEVIEVLEEK